MGSEQTARERWTELGLKSEPGEYIERAESGQRHSAEKLELARAVVAEEQGAGDPSPDAEFDETPPEEANLDETPVEDADDDAPSEQEPTPNEGDLVKARFEDGQEHEGYLVGYSMGAVLRMRDGLGTERFVRATNMMLVRRAEPAGVAAGEE